MVSSSSYCTNIITVDGVPVGNRKIGIVILATGILYLMTAVILIFFIEKKVKDAHDGRESAQKAVIFPIYVQILWGVVITNIYVCILTLVFSYGTETQELESSSVWALSVMKMIQHAVTEGVAFLLMRKGLGIHAAMKTLKLATVWGVITLVVKIIVYYSYYKFGQSTLANVLNNIYNFIILVFYLCLWLLPDHRLFRRPAAKTFAKFWVFFRIVASSAEILSYSNNESVYAASLCINVIVVFLMLGIFEPYMVYFCLLEDCRWWQGMGDQGSISLLAGVEVDHTAAMQLAARLDAMSSNSNVARNVRLLNFAYITLDRKTMLGAGSFSKVYRGTYRSEPCAIKLIFTVDLTIDVINRVAAEAQLLSRIQDPNIVKIFGVSVLPPSVCILLELCAFGSLADICQGTAPDIKGTGNKVGRAQTILHDMDKFYLALGCAKGLAALHSHGAELVHRDIKSFNFLVDHKLNCKLADLELGSDHSGGKGRRRSAKQAGDLGENIIAAFSINMKKKTPNSGYTPSDLEAGISINQEDILPNYVAPEILQNLNEHNQASDVYAFGIVLWEIISGLNPFHDVKKKDDVRARIIAGERPEIPAIFLDPSSLQYSKYSKYIALIYRCWQHTANLRPVAVEIVNELRNIYRETQTALVFDTRIASDLTAEDLSQPIKRANSVNSADSSPKQRQNSAESSISPIWSLIKPDKDDVALAISKDEFSAKVAKVVNDPAYKNFDNDTGAWMLVTPESPHLVLRVSSAWKRYTGNDSKNYFDPLLEDNVFGLPLRQVMTGPLTEMQELLEFERSLSADNFKTSHSMLTLYKDLERDAKSPNDVNSPFRDAASKSTDTTSNMHLDGSDEAQKYSLYSLHAFPIRLRSAEVETPSHDRTISTASQVSEDESYYSTNDDVTGSLVGSYMSTRSSLSYEGVRLSASVDTEKKKSSFLRKASELFTQRAQQELEDETKNKVATIAILFSEFKETSAIAYQRRSSVIRSSNASVASVISSVSTVVTEKFTGNTRDANTFSDRRNNNSNIRSSIDKKRTSESSQIKLEGVYRTSINSLSVDRTMTDDVEFANSSQSMSSRPTNAVITFGPNSARSSQRTSGDSRHSIDEMQLMTNIILSSQPDNEI